MNNFNRKENYDALYKDYFQASVFGVVVIIISKLYWLAFIIFMMLLR